MCSSSSYLSALFYGDKALVMEWMDSFFNVNFGFTGAFENFSLDQISGLKSVHVIRVLLGKDYHT